MFSETIKILIVDDSPMARILIREILSQLKFHNIVEAVDGLDAIQVLDKFQEEGKQVDLVIADWNMPRMNGLDLLVTMKQHLIYRDIPFLMVTAESDRSLVTLAVSSGADEFIFKPVTEEAISEKLEKIWKNSQKEKKTPLSDD